MAVSPTDVAVHAVDVHKTYHGPRGNVTAVDGLSVDVFRGEAFGLLGPNGAGKSTTVGILTTRVRATSGEVTVAGADVRRDPVGVKRHIGVVSQANTLDRQLTSLENLEFRGRFAGMRTKDARARGMALLEQFGLADRADTKVQFMSGGQAQRVMIGRALVTSPDILFLDEPTSGLDPQTRVNLWDTLRDMRNRGQTILLTTHYLEEAEALCERIAVVDKGVVLASGTADELKRASGGDSVVTITFAQADLVGIATEATGLPGVSNVEIEGTELRVITDDSQATMAAVLRRSLGAGLEITDVSVQKPSLETVFLALTGREYRE